MEASFNVNIRSTEEAVIFELHGDLTREAERRLLELRPWETHRDGKRNFLILNLSQVPYINSAGIALLIRLTRSAGKEKMRTFACGVTPHYEKLFRMVGLTEQMMIYPDEYAIMERISALNNGQGTP